MKTWQKIYSFFGFQTVARTKYNLSIEDYLKKNAIGCDAQGEKEWIKHYIKTEGTTLKTVYWFGRSLFEYKIK